MDLVLRLGRELAAGLAAAHRRGLIHRDIKPANIWLEAPIGRAKILDFGLARTQGHDVQITNPGSAVGTPAYMAPEQARGEGDDASCDLFSLGCVLYQLCTRRLPFPGTTVIAVLTSLSMDTPPLPRELNPALPPALDELIMRLLAKQPTDRPPTAQAVVEAIKGASSASCWTETAEGRALGMRSVDRKDRPCGSGPSQQPRSGEPGADCAGTSRRPSDLVDRRGGAGNRHRRGRRGLRPGTDSQESWRGSSPISRGRQRASPRIQAGSSLHGTRDRELVFLDGALVASNRGKTGRLSRIKSPPASPRYRRRPPRPGPNHPRLGPANRQLGLGRAVVRSR